MKSVGNYLTRTAHCLKYVNDVFSHKPPKRGEPIHDGTTAQRGIDFQTRSRDPRGKKGTDLIASVSLAHGLHWGSSPSRMHFLGLRNCRPGLREPGKLHPVHRRAVSV